MSATDVIRFVGCMLVLAATLGICSWLEHLAAK